ncbi:MFS transporter [Teredinibacter haidensis]|uniref:MFS transporter n=1 Tax=Teredinibacter haidensis TaxID=2731755 RepID=UPI000AD30201|nr:MFS transporter [Teredinibacter haidensis]
MTRPIKHFLVAHGASAFALGIHQVLLAWLAISLLQVEAHQLGWVQAAGLIPNLVLMLVSGSLADKRSTYRMMLLAQLGLTLCYLFLVIVLSSGGIHYYWLLLYAVGVGSANAFIQPAREKLIGELSDQSVQVKITRASIVQFSLQAVGIAVAGLSDQIGFTLVICLQVVVSVFAVLQLWVLTKQMDVMQEEENIVQPDSGLVSSTGLGPHILEGVKVALADSRIAQLIGLVSFNGFMHMGLYIVAIPLLARDAYGFNALQYGFLQLCFVMGMLSAYLLLMFKPQIEFPAQGALFSLLYAAIVGFALSRQPTVAGLYILIVFWGWIAGHSATHCRMLMQILAGPKMKGRMMSLYQLMLFGMAPLGALTTGYYTSLFSLSTIFTVLSGASVALFLVFMFARSLWVVRQI